MQEKKRWMKILKQPLNNHGSILQIVLVIFLIILSVISISTSLLISKMKSYQDVDLLMKQKNLEIMLVRFYIDSIENDVLMSDSIESEDYSVKYYVDNMGSYFSITTLIEIADIHYQLKLNIDNENYDVKKIEYLEGNI